MEDKLDDLPVPAFEAKSYSLVPPEQFKNLHPRMLYEVLKHVKDYGSVNANQIAGILKEFDDLNTAN